MGVSTGGSAALETFFENCPTESGAAFVVIQDIPTKHESLTAGLLAQCTRMSVEMIETDTRVRPDHVYLNPPGTAMRIEKGVLRLTPCDEGRSLPIDSFFTSLAEECGDRASGILLSGTGSDGTRDRGRPACLQERCALGRDRGDLQGARGFCLKWDDIMRRPPSRPQKTVGRVTSGRLRPGLPANRSSWSSRPSPVSLPPAGPTHLRPVPTGST
ncbi:chemotaxis protein CheB [Rhodovulum sulfidophilum]|uniref:chemotaxis protein CheB n=1 Tax=Rhodovulum sulfidophilum TaxID=35806 RepID=UPI003B21A13C